METPTGSAPVCRVGAILLVLALGACVSTRAPISGEQKLTGQEGAVVLKLITNGSRASDPAETLSSIHLRRETPPDTPTRVDDRVVLVRTRTVTRTTAVFSGMVAPGRYHVVSAVGGAGNITYTFPLSPQLSGFDVKEGEVSLLGTVLIQPLGGTRFLVGYVPPDTELIETFEQLFPALASQTRGKPTHTLEMTPAMNRRVQLAPRFKELPASFSGFKIFADGSVLACGKVGRIVWRKPGEHRWRVLNVGSWKEVLSVRPYRNGLLVAGEEALLRYTADEGRTWVALTAPENGLIAAAEPMPNGKVIALVRRGSEWSAYLSDDALNGAWRKLGAFAQERSFNLPGQDARAIATGNRAGVMMPNGEFVVADADTGTIERSSTGFSTLGVDVMPDGMLVVRGTTLGSTTLISNDGGRSWIDLHTSRFVRAITFADANKVYAVAPIDPGIFAGTYALMMSRDGGRTWAQSGSTPGGNPGEVQDLAVDRTDGSLLAFLRSGNILRSTDEGKNWVREL